jgi:hypothetical protein
LEFLGKSISYSEKYKDILNIADSIAEMYLYRGIEFSSKQDYNNGILNLNKADSITMYTCNKFLRQKVEEAKTIANTEMLYVYITVLKKAMREKLYGLRRIIL